MDNMLVMDGIIGHKEINKFGDLSFSNLNPTTFVKFNAHEVLEAEFAKTLLEPNKLYIIIGTDSGLLPKYLIEKGILEDCRYIFIEPKEILDQLLKENVLIPHEHIAYADEDNWLVVADDFKIKDYIFINGVESYRAFCARNSMISSYAELGWYIDEKLRQVHYEIATGTGMEPFLAQQIMNLPSNQHPIILLKDAFKGKTAFVLGGGPSLDDALPWLVKHRQSVVILAVSRVTKRLLEVGLEPDFFFSVDPFPVNFDVSKDIFSLSSAPIFINRDHVYHELLDQWPGRSFYFGQRVPWDSKLNVTNPASWAPTVTNTAICAALHLGFKRIFLAGVDFSYTLDGFTHAKGSMEHNTGARFNLTGVEVETYSGVMAPTGLDYAFARDMLEEQIQNVVDAEQAQLFNISLMAAKVEGIEHHPIASISVDNEPVIVETIINKCLLNDKNQSFFDLAYQEIRHLLIQLKTIKRIAQEALECNDTMYNEQGLITNYKDKIRLEKLEKQLNQKHKKYSSLVQIFGLRQFLKMTKPFDDELATAEEIKERLHIYYQSYVEGSEKLIALLERTEKKITAYAEEHKAKPNWDLIIENARLEGSFGRVRIWNKMNGAKKLPDEYTKIFVEFEERFQQSLKTPKSNHHNVVKQQADLSVLTQQAQVLFGHKKIEQLKNLLLTLENHHDKQQAMPYRHLVLGYIEELEHRFEQALSEYHQIIEQGEGPLEHALLRIIVIDLDVGSGALAHQALEVLTQLNQRYFAFYADSCRIRGNFLDAINSYIKYLSYFPGDVFVQLKLVQLYIDQKLYEGAELMLNHILANNPKNQNALHLQKQLHEIKDGMS